MFCRGELIFFLFMSFLDFIGVVLAVDLSISFVASIEIFAFLCDYMVIFVSAGLNSSG